MIARMGQLIGVDENNLARHFGDFCGVPTPRQPTTDHPNQCNQTALPNNLRKSSFIQWVGDRDACWSALLQWHRSILTETTKHTTRTLQHTTAYHIIRERTSTSPGSEFRGCCFLARLVDHFLDSPNPVLNVAFIDGTLRARQINVHDDCVWACVFLSINRRL